MSNTPGLLVGPASQAMGLDVKEVAVILGVTCNEVTSMVTGHSDINFGSDLGKRCRAFLDLSSALSSNAGFIPAWKFVRLHETGLNGIPVEIMKTPGGIERVLAHQIHSANVRSSFKFN